MPHGPDRPKLLIHVLTWLPEGITTFLLRRWQRVALDRLANLYVALFLLECQYGQLPERLLRLKILLEQSHYDAAWAPPTSNLMRRTARISAVVLLLVVAAFVGFRWSWTTYRTSIGGSGTVNLPDGSVIQLDTDTQIRTRMTKWGREVILIRGQAHFAVAHDSHRPFVVQADGLTLRDVGTEFTVRRDLDGERVVVTAGLVAVHHASLPDRLYGLVVNPDPTRPAWQMASAGNVVTHRKGAIAVEPISPQQMAALEAWRNGFLVLTGQPLSDVVREVNRYNYTTIRVADPSIMDSRIVVAIQPRLVERLLKQLQVYGFRVVRHKSPDAGEVVCLYGANSDITVSAEGC